MTRGGGERQGVFVRVQVVFTKPSESYLSTGFHLNRSFDMGLCYMLHDGLYTDIYFIRRVFRFLVSVLR